MRAQWIAIVGLAAAANFSAFPSISSGQVRADTPAAQLEKGIFQQETAGDLDAAEKCYWQIVDAASANRHVVAEAQYRLGVCYLKQGKQPEAEMAFLELVANFPGESALVGKAQKELDAMELARAPRIVSTSPAAFADDVPATLDKMTVTFDRKMEDGAWSWTQESDETFPKIEAHKHISYDTAMTTCTLPCKVEPGKVYWVGINNGDFRNFCSADGDPAVSYAILFATQSSDGKPTPIPADMLDRAKAMNAKAAAASSVPPLFLSAESGMAVPEGATRFSYVKDRTTDKWSLGGSGHAVLFERPAKADTLIAVQIFAGRYGMANPPAEDFHVYLLDEKRNILSDFRFPYGMIRRTTDMHWYNLPIRPPTALPQKFHIALNFNPQQTKGIYLGIDKDVSESHSFTGVPGLAKGLVTVNGTKFAGEWMVRPVLISGKPGEAAEQHGQ